MPDTPHVGTFPVPYWLKEFFSQDEFGDWWFHIPGFRSADTNPLLDVCLAAGDAFHNALLNHFRPIIAAVAEVAWRVRAERWHRAASRLHLMVGDIPVAAPMYSHARRRLEAGLNRANERGMGATRAVAACRAWGGGTR